MYSHTHTLHSPHPGIPQNLDPCHLNFTDGQQLVVQATDDDSPNSKNTVYLKSVKQPQELKTESFADGNDKQQSEEPSIQPRSGKFLPLSMMKWPNEFNTTIPWLIYCSPVCVHCMFSTHFMYIFYI